MTPASVGIVVPAYNAEQFLHEALDSVLEQTFQQWELVVVDDGSTDGTRAVAEAYSRRDRRIQIVSGPNVGLPAARNKGMELLSNPYIALLDADDVWLPELLARLVDTMERYPVDLVACHHSTFTGDPRQSQRVPREGLAWDQALGPESFAGELRKLCFFMPSGVLLRGSRLFEVGGFDEKLLAVEDWDLWLRLADQGASALVLSEPLFLKRLHGSNLSSNLERMFRYNFLVMKRHSVDKGSPATDFRAPARLHFRNTLTLLGDTGDISTAVALFEEYHQLDPDGYACRALRLIQPLLSERLFWLVARFAVIPLAWHLERWGERREARR